MNPKLKNLLTYVAIALFLVGGIYVTSNATRHYLLKPALISGQIAYKGDECFFVLSPAWEGKSPSLLTRWVPGRFAMFLVPDLERGDLIVYHYSAGHFQRFELSGTSNVFRLTLVKGALVLAGSYGNDGRPLAGKRWTGTGFVSLTGDELKGNALSGTSAKIEDEDDDSENPRDVLQEAGWSQKYIYPSTKDRTVPIHLAKSELVMTERSTRDMNDLFGGISTLDLAGPGLKEPAESLWTGADWKEVSRNEYVRVVKPKGHEETLGLLVFASIITTVLPYTPLLLVIYRIFRIKKNILKNQSKQHTFQPVTQDLFPHLDRVTVDRFSKDLESLGFTLQMEFTLVGNASKLVGTYARLYTNTQQNLFAEVFQVFAGSKEPRPVSANVSTSFTDGWVLTTSKSKPLPMAALQRLPRQMSVLMPEASVRELYQSHIQKRSEITSALGVFVLTDTTREAYIARSNRLSAERYEKLQKSSIYLGMLKVLQRKINPSYEWMGDFKKEAAKRGSFASAAAVGRG